MERYRNKRMLFRSGGRFAKAPSLEQMGFDVCDGPRRCSCGHVWSPLLASGRCPECGAQDSVPIEPEPDPMAPVRVSCRFFDPRWRFPQDGEVLEDGLRLRVGAIEDRFTLEQPLPPGTKVCVTLDRWLWARPQKG